MDTKRVFDILFSSLVLILGAPVFLVCFLAIKLSSQGPAFYACERIGKDGIPFRCWKFRTMVVDAETLLPELLASNPSLSREWKTFYKLRQDPRVTSIGKWLRKTSLDELPQFWNVLRGDMSIVGPRPLTKEEVAHYLKGKASKILSLRPGLTSLWAVAGRSQLSYAQRLRLEVEYVENHSLKLDFSLIGKTILSVLTLKGAF
jgi:exopolysaccharide production protein ExoY